MDIKKKMEGTSFIYHQLRFYETTVAICCRRRRYFGRGRDIFGRIWPT